jgi:hypothetical protein
LEISTLTVRADGTLHLDRTTSEGETRTVPRERLRPLPVVCWSGICGLGVIDIGALGPINTLLFDHKSGSPES